MDLYNHSTPLFTQWVIEGNLLLENFVIVDIGVQGGAHPRWAYLGRYAEIHGFDPISEVIADLKARLPGKGKVSYYNMALGDEDGTRQFFVSRNQPSSSFYSSDREAEQREVAIHRLDTLFREGLIPRADYIKLDCEGFEADILRGGREYLAASDIICVTSETNFFVSPVYPKTHFQAVNDILVDYRLLAYDWNLVRTPTAEYVKVLSERPWPEPNALLDAPRLDVGRPTTYDVVFCRDFVNELRNADAYSASGPSRPPSVDTIIKSMINFELHGLMDCAVQLAVVWRDELATRMDVERAIDLLSAPPPHSRNTADVTSCLKMIDELRRLIPEVQREVYLQRESLSVQLAGRVSPSLRRMVRKVIGEASTKKLVSWLRG